MNRSTDQYIRERAGEGCFQHGKRVTLLIPEAVDLHLEKVAKEGGYRKSRLVAEALVCYLIEDRSVPDPLTRPSKQEVEANVEPQNSLKKRIMDVIARRAGPGGP